MRLQARAWARARPKPDPTRQSGRAQDICGPEPAQARPDPGLSGPTRPAHHYAAPLIQSDYPLILWWDQQDWTAHLTENSGMSTGSAPGPRGSTRAAAGINVTMLYVQYATGDVINGFRATVINGFRATEIKSFATQLFNEMARAGIDPAMWHTGGRDIQQHFYAEIGARFPEMCLCSQDWKTRHMATHMYPSWHGSYLKRKAKQDPDPTSVKRAKKEETQDGLDLNDMYTMPDDILAEQSPVTGNTNVDASASSSLAVEPPKISIKIVNPLFSSPPPEPQPENNEAPTELTGVPASLLSTSTAVSSASSESPPAALPLLTPEPGSSTATTTFNSAQGVTSVTVTLPDSALVEPDAAVDGAVLPATPQTAGTTPFLPIQPAMPAPPVVPVAPAEPAAATASAPATITDGPKKESVMKPTNSKTPRNLCAIAWCKKNPGGYTSKFKTHWDSIKNKEVGKVRCLYVHGRD
ncbi:hypothetical protein B0H10DRAFT_2015079 [Mycena sp. CBHHK59/15]|nr:hypothetical protein B0H10DRAFT_2015079 [Mycena sp. CBHHK59/15]